MGLLNRLFGGKGGAGADADASGDTQPQSSQFHESETTAQDHGQKNAPRRELVQVVLRDTMRKHGIPSDWIDCRVLSVVTRQHQSGMHVQFIICKGQSRLLNYVHEFQESFWEEIEKFEPQAREWLFSLAWQFDGGSSRVSRSMPIFGGDRQPSGDTQPSDLDEEELASDLQALYAIRDAAIAQSEPPAAVPASRARGPAGS
jgi:hypothetical protein